ncbi:hypothetical protein BHE74_00026298 [Ensete ventricosum]|nr:hypothetical protein GW17_00000418 [Ensete ventricosum]RWW66333.1 hypothetical protein BHE74_00026298 [Ensete ventricosum]RZR83056.1 hypothetical protein BHM03_00009593 [Ensete ventricosum]
MKIKGATSPRSFSPHGRRIARRGRPGDRSGNAGDRAIDRIMQEEIQVLLFFFLPPSAKTTRNRPTTVEINRYRSISCGNGRKQLLPGGLPDSERSAYRSIGELIRTPRYGGLSVRQTLIPSIFKANVSLKDHRNSVAPADWTF